MVFSCKNDTANESINYNDDEVIEKAINSGGFIDGFTATPARETLSYVNLIDEKLKALYELLELKNKHPEFAESIEMQLQKYSSDTISLIRTNISIKNIEIGDEIISLSDSLQKFKVYYNIESEEFTKKDSIYALITTMKLLIEGETKTSKKVRFETIKN